MQRLPMKAAANEVAEVFGLSKRDLLRDVLRELGAFTFPSILASLEC